MYYLRQIHLPSGSDRQFPFSLKALKELGTMSFESPITVFVGENGSGKSTLLKALAIKLNLPAIGSTDLESDETLDGVKSYGEQIITQWKDRAFRGFFFRAEDYFGFVKRLQNMDSEMKGDIVDFEKRLSGTGLKLAVGSILGQKEALLRKYGNLTEVSHGEGFLKVLEGRLQNEGIYLIDEPEAALSPQRQLAQKSSGESWLPIYHRYPLSYIDDLTERYYFPVWRENPESKLRRHRTFHHPKKLSQ